MGKAALFAQRVARHGKAVTLYPFLGYATGTYVNAAWNAPDPNSATYPASGTAPGIRYNTGQAVKAIVQPARGTGGGQRFVRTPLGEEIEVRLRAYFAHAVTPGLRDRVVVDGTAFWIVTIEPWEDAGELIYRLAWLAQEVI